MEEAKKNPEFLKYILYIFVYGNNYDINEGSRVIAGYTLKSCIKFLYGEEDEQSKAYIRNGLIQSLIDPSIAIRNASGVVISQLMLVIQLSNWPELLPALMELLNSSDENYIITALSCLSKMMEDDIFSFDDSKLGNPLNTLIPRFLSFFTNANRDIVYHSVRCMRFTIDSMSNALLSYMNDYLQVSASMSDCRFISRVWHG